MDPTKHASPDNKVETEKDWIGDIDTYDGRERIVQPFLKKDFSHD